MYVFIYATLLNFYYHTLLYSHIIQVDIPQHFTAREFDWVVWYSYLILQCGQVGAGRSSFHCSDLLCLSTSKFLPLVIWMPSHSLYSLIVSILQDACCNSCIFISVHSLACWKELYLVNNFDCYDLEKTSTWILWRYNLATECVIDFT